MGTKEKAAPESQKKLPKKTQLPRVLVGKEWPRINELREHAHPTAETLKPRIIAWFSAIFGGVFLAVSVYALGTEDQTLINKILDHVVVGVYAVLTWAGVKALTRGS